MFNLFKSTQQKLLEKYGWYNKNTNEITHEINPNCFSNNKFPDFLLSIGKNDWRILLSNFRIYEPNIDAELPLTENDLILIDKCLSIANTTHLP